MHTKENQAGWLGGIIASVQLFLFIAMLSLLVTIWIPAL